MSQQYIAGMSGHNFIGRAAKEIEVII